MLNRFDDETKPEILCERVGRSYNFAHIIARPEVKEPEVPSGAFAYFCRHGQKYLVAGATKLPYASAGRNNSPLFYTKTPLS